MSTNVRHRKIIALDWDQRTLRIVHAHVVKRGAKIDRILSVAIPAEVDSNDPEQLGAHIQRALDQEGITAKHAIVDIPRDQAILKTLSLPLARPDDLPGIVQIQIGKELPFPASEAIIDFAVSEPGAEAGQQEVLVAVVRREVLAQYDATLEAAGLKLDRAGLRPHANKIAVCAQLKFAIPDRVVFIDLRPTLTEIDVLRNSALVFSRAASVLIPGDVRETREVAGGLRLSVTHEPEELPDQAPVVPGETRSLGGTAGIIQALLVEVTRSLEAYRAADAGAQIDHAVIAGDTGIEESLADAIQKRLGIPAELYNPATTFGWSAEEGAAASAFSASLGLVLGHADAAGSGFDFLHPKKMVSRTQKRLKTLPTVGSLAASLLLVIILGFIWKTAPARAKLADLDNQIKDLTAKKADGKKLLDVMDIIHDFDSGQLIWVDVLMDILQCLPTTEELVLTQVDLQQKDAKVTLKTKAKTRETATKVEQQLREFRREGKELPRFEVSTGAQVEKKGEKYPYWQDFRVTVNRDDAPKKGPGRTLEKKQG